jgi:hypothetical protein
MKLFFDSYNVTHVLTYQDKWNRYLDSHPDVFRKEKDVPSHDLTIALYTVRRPFRALVKGTGRVSARFNRIDVVLDETDGDVVLPYNWIDGLRAPDGVEIFPYEADEEITLIGVRPGGTRNFSITYRNWL